ncbi:LPS translocon maturation chaperone LptM [Dokdonella sp. MW10]
MPRLARLTCLIALCAAIAACGNKGDLVKPNTGPVPAPAPAGS